MWMRVVLGLYKHAYVYFVITGRTTTAPIVAPIGLLFATRSECKCVNCAGGSQCSLISKKPSFNFGNNDDPS